MPVRVGLIVLGLLVVSALPVRAGDPPGGGPDPADLTAFADGFFAAWVDRLRVPGAVLVLVRDGQVVLARGYGYADLELRRPMDPDRTVLRVASVSKPVVAAAVMQLVEQGRVDLHADVNAYLRRLRVPNTYPEPVTLAGLLSHTGGLDERLIGIAARRPADLLPLREYLAARLPPRVYPPGQVIRYSNDGVALAALVVEEVSGQGFGAYAREKIFGPLGMVRTGYDPTPELVADLAAGYESRGGVFRRVPFDYFQVGPAAGLLTTASDLARFTVAMLEGGRYGEVRILKEESVREMQRRQFGHHPRLPGWTLGFFEYDAGGRRALAHDGDWRGFAALVFLLPEERTGLFVANNGRNHYLNWEFVRRFLDRYHPTLPEPPADPKGSFDDPGRFAGSYRTVRYGRGTVEKLVTLVEQFRVTVSADGRLWLHGLGPEPVGFVPVEPLLFRRVDGAGHLAFRADAAGRITHLFLGGDRLFPTPLALERVPWYETTGVQLGLVAAFVAAFGSAVLRWPLGRLGLGGRKPKAPGLFDPVAFTVGGLNLTTLAGVAVGLFVIDRYEFAYGIPAGLLVALRLPLLSAALTPVLWALAIRDWLVGAGTAVGRLYRLGIALAGALFTWFALTWNLPAF